MGWLIAFAVLGILALMPLGLQVRYDASGAFAAFVIGPAKIQLYPSKPSEKSADGEKKQKAAKPQQAKKSGGSVSDFLPLVQLIIDFLKDFRLRVRVDNLRLKWILGGGDPCDLALHYGQGWAALGNLMPLLERTFVIKKRDLEVECDFTAPGTTVIAGADLTVRFWQLAALAVTHGPKVIKQYFNIMNKRKGGAKYESKSS